MKAFEKLTLESVTVRAVAIPMRRPIVAKVGTYPEWPFILIINRAHFDFLVVRNNATLATTLHDNMASRLTSHYKS